MAFAVPGPPGPGVERSTTQEARLLATLTERLPDDWLVYHHAALTGRPPAFVVIAPELGVALLEARQGAADALDPGTPAGVLARRVVTHPLARALADLTPLGDDAVRQVVLLPGVRRADLAAPQPAGRTLADALGAADCLVADDLEGDLGAALARLFPARRATPLTAAEVDAVRALVFPELRVQWAGRDVVLDREQDRLAHLPPEGHHLVRGGAGAGKTVTLLARARFLRAQRPGWRILLLVFNRVAADLLREALEPDERLEVLHFHTWCWRSLERAGIPIPPTGGLAERAKYWSEVIPALMVGALRGNRLTTRFDAILVDDAHDFPASWLAVVAHALNPQAQSLMLACDPWQTPPGWEAGLAAAGLRPPLRHELRANHRLHRQIVVAAEALVRRGTLGAPGPPAPAPAPAAASTLGLKGGFAPDVRRFRSAEEERQQAAAWIRQKLHGQAAPASILVLGLLRPDMVELETWLEDMGIVSRLVGGRSIPGVVRLSTIHGARGLEADFVLLLQAHQLEELRPAEARHLLYTAMTRARLQLSVYSHRPSALLDELDELVNPSTVVPWAPPRRRAPAPAPSGLIR